MNEYKFRSQRNVRGMIWTDYLLVGDLKKKMYT